MKKHENTLDFLCFFERSFLKMKLRCLLGIHKLKPVDFKNENFKDKNHGWIEQDYCIFCDYKSAVRTYY